MCESAVARISALLEKGDFQQAEDFLANLEKADASLLLDPLLVAARRRCRAAREQEAERTQDFAEALEEARAAPLNEVEPRALVTARKLARLEAENRALSELIQEREARRNESREKRESGFRPQLETINHAVQRLAKRLDQHALEFDRFQEELDGSRRELDELEPELATASNDLKQLGTEVHERLEAVAQRFLKRQNEARRIDEITEAAAFSAAEPVDDLGLFATRLHAFVKAYPGEPSSKAFETYPRRTAPLGCDRSVEHLDQ